MILQQKEKRAGQKQDQLMLPYEPIKFVYTETIGSVLERFKEIVDPYTWWYEDILEPKTLSNPSKVEYYLFHVAPIYNWLRKLDSQVLSNYINRQSSPTLPNSSNNNLNTSSILNKQNSIYRPFEQKTFQYELKHYISQWQIVKLCICAKIKIITTKILKQDLSHRKSNNQDNNNSNRNNSNTLNKIVVSQQQLICPHLIKKEKFTQQYHLNNFQPNNPRLQCNKIYCEDCQKHIHVKAQIIRLPFAPYFNKYHGKQFILSQNNESTNKLRYQLILVYTQQKVFVKTSGGVWYETGKDRTAIVSFEKIDLKAGQFFVYQQAVAGNRILRKAEKMVEKMQDVKKRLSTTMIDQNDDSQGQNNLQVQIVNRHKEQKPFQQQVPHEKDKIQQVQQDEEKLQQLVKVQLPVVMNKKKTDKKLFKQYKRTVESLLPKPRLKDEYQKQYDKGKTKKIHKNRQQFRTADFFQLYNKVKNNPLQKVSKHRDEHDIAEQKAELKANGRDQTLQNKNGLDDENDYNYVQSDKRAHRGRFGRKGHEDRGKNGKEFKNKNKPHFKNNGKDKGQFKKGHQSGSKFKHNHSHNK